MHAKRLKTSSFIAQKSSNNTNLKGYRPDLLDKHISAVEKFDQNEMLKEKVRDRSKQTRISRTLTYSQFYQYISKVIRKHWKFLTLNESL